MDIVRPLVTSEDYVVQKYTKAHPFKAMGRVQVSASAETSPPFGSTTRYCSTCTIKCVLRLFRTANVDDRCSVVSLQILRSQVKASKESTLLSENCQRKRREAYSSERGYLGTTIYHVRPSYRDDAAEAGTRTEILGGL